jgi:hypothetical protein
LASGAAHHWRRCVSTVRQSSEHEVLADEEHLPDDALGRRSLDGDLGRTDVFRSAKKPCEPVDR